MARTRLSGKGQLMIPKPARERHSWTPGTELEIEDRGEAVVLRGVGLWPRATVKEVFGCLRADGPPRYRGRDGRGGRTETQLEDSVAYMCHLRAEGLGSHLSDHGER